jgi:hypothetical protein
MVTPDEKAGDINIYFVPVAEDRLKIAGGK